MTRMTTGLQGSANAEQDRAQFAVSRPVKWNASTRSMVRRVLARHDGSTISLLESLTDSVVALSIKEHRTVRHANDVAVLQVTREAPVLRRRVELTIRRRVVVRATAAVALDRLPHDFVSALARKTMALGELIRRHRLDTYREPGDCRLNLGDGVLTRTYRILHRDLPVAQVTEHFLLAALEDACAAAD